MFKKFVVVISTVLTMALCCVGLVGCNTSKKVEENEVEEILNNFDVVIDDNSNVENTYEGSILEPTIRLSSGTSVASATGVSKTLEATVYPEDAFNLEVLWTLEWAEGTDLNESVFDYFMLTDENRIDNVSKVTVTCLKAFLGYEAKVKCTTVDGGYSATCKLVYLGKPSSLSISYEGTNVSTILNLSPGHHSFNYKLENVLGVVADDYSTISFAEGKLLGNVIFKVVLNSDLPTTLQQVLFFNYNGHTDTWSYAGAGTSTWDDASIREVIDAFGGITFDDFFSNINITDSIFNVTVKTALDGFTKYFVNSNGNQNTLTFYSIPDGNSFYGQIKMEVPNTDVCEYIGICPVTGVLSVGLSDNSITF